MKKFFLLAFFLLVPQAHASIAYVNVGTAITASPVTVDITGCSTNNAYIAIGIFGSTHTVSSVVINGVNNATQISTHAAGGTNAYTLDLYGFAGATTSTQQIIVTASQSVLVDAACYSGAAQSNQPDTNQFTSNTGGPSSFGSSFTGASVTTVDKDWGFEIVMLDAVANPLSSGTNCNVRTVNSGQGIAFCDTAGDITPAGNTYTMTVNQSGSGGKWYSLIASFKPFVSVAPLFQLWPFSLF